MRCKLEELDQPVVGGLDVLIACVGSKAQATEQLLPELGRICTTPHGYWMTTHAVVPVYLMHPAVTVMLMVSQLVSI